MSDTQGVGQPAQQPRRSKRGRRILALILVLLFLLLAGITFLLVQSTWPQGRVASNAQDAGGLTWVRSIYGWGRGKSQMLGTPGSVAIGNGGVIWTNNPGGRNVVGFRPDGTLFRVVNGTNKTRFVAPTDVGTDPAGNVYVGENTTSRVIVMTPTGQELRIMKVQTPTVVTASNDRIVVGSSGGFAIFDKEGNPLKVIGERGYGDSQFDSVNGAVIGPNGNIYIVDTYNNRLSAYDSKGNRIWIVSTGNPGNKSPVAESTRPKASVTPAKLQLPEQMTMDGAGRLVVVDAFDFSLNVFNPKNGAFIAKYGAYGVEDGKLLYPSGVAYDRTRDWFAVADTNNERLQIFRMPDSAPGNVTSAIQRSLAGPLRACIFPFILLIIAIVLWLLSRRGRRKKVEETSAQNGESAQNSLEG